MYIHTCMYFVHIYIHTYICIYRWVYKQAHVFDQKRRVPKRKQADPQHAEACAALRHFTDSEDHALIMAASRGHFFKGMLLL